jgi:hypothetical protein
MPINQVKQTVKKKPIKKAGKRKASPQPMVYKSGIYECPKCHTAIEMFVKMTSPPACHNHYLKEFAIMTPKKKVKEVQQ